MEELAGSLVGKVVIVYIVGEENGTTLFSCQKMEGEKDKKDLKKMEKKVDFLDYLWYYNTRLKKRGKLQ